jgi:beta-glucanase (GH16 family)
MFTIVGANKWISGEVMTHETYRYGKFVARIRGDDELGTITSLFTFWKGDTSERWSYGGWSELDVELVPSEKDGTYNTNIIWSNMQ